MEGTLNVDGDETVFGYLRCFWHTIDTLGTLYIFWNGVRSVGNVSNHRMHTNLTIEACNENGAALAQSKKKHAYIIPSIMFFNLRPLKFGL